MHNFFDLIVGGHPLETKFNTLIGSLPVKSNLNKQTIVDSILLKMQQKRRPHAILGLWKICRIRKLT